MRHRERMVRKLALVVTGLALGTLAACGAEDWGGPKGPPPPPPAAPVALAAPPASFDAGAEKFEIASAAPSAARTEAKLPGDAGPPLFAHVEGSISGGKIPDYEETVAGMRPALKACVEGKGELDAVVEITAKVGVKGAVTGTDSTGGTQFSEGAVPCLVKRIEGASFKKPSEGSPRVTFRVKMRRD
jgi:hypothetical protein